VTGHPVNIPEHKHRRDQYFALLVGTDKSRGYCLEMICAEFLAGANLEAGAENRLFLALARLTSAVPVAQRLQLLDIVRNGLEPIRTEVAATEA
jgi:hypothetical protein